MVFGQQEVVWVIWALFGFRRLSSLKVQCCAFLKSLTVMLWGGRNEDPRPPSTLLAWSVDLPCPLGIHIVTTLSPTTNPAGSFQVRYAYNMGQPRCSLRTAAICRTRPSMTSSRPSSWDTRLENARRGRQSSKREANPKPPTTLV